MSNATATEKGRIPSLTLGWRLRMSLADSGMSRGQMAELLEVHETTVTRWMHDKGAPPKRPALIQWALATDTDPGWLRSGKSPARDGGGSRSRAASMDTGK